MEEKTYYERLFEETEKEKELRRKINEETARYQATDAFKEHEEKLDTLFEELKEAGKERRASAKAKFKRCSEPKKIDMAAFRAENERKYQEKFAAYPDELKAALEAYNSLNEEQKKVFRQDTLVGFYDYDKYENPQTTEEDLKELLEILVQTTIDFIDERGLKDIDAVHFGADGLQSSAEAGEWVCFTDANIGVYGIGTEKDSKGNEYQVVKKIGEYL